MTTLPIILLPDPILRVQSEPIEKIDDELHKFTANMIDTMYDAPGIGLAAIQVGVARRILVLDVDQKEAEEGEEAKKEPLVFINPKIITSSVERSTYEEGCLSIPDYFANVERPATITVEYLNLDGKQITTEASGLLATCLQHEIDHLDGVLFIDYISKLKRDMVIRKFTKLAKQQPAKIL